MLNNSNSNSNSISNNTVIEESKNIINKFRSKIKYADLNGLLRISRENEWKSLSPVIRRKILTNDRKKYIIRSVKEGLCKMNNKNNIELKIFNILNTGFINKTEINRIRPKINQRLKSLLEKQNFLNKRKLKIKKKESKNLIRSKHLSTRNDTRYTNEYINRVLREINSSNSIKSVNKIVSNFRKSVERKKHKYDNTYIKLANQLYEIAVQKAMNKGRRIPYVSGRGNRERNKIIKKIRLIRSAYKEQNTTPPYTRYFSM